MEPSPDMLARIVEAVEERIPFNRMLGLERFEVREDRSVAVHVPMRDELVGNYERGALHGGVISATLDLVGGIAALLGAVDNLITESEEEARKVFVGLGTIDLRVDYLRPAVGSGFDATASVLRAGRRVAVTRMEMTDDEGRRVAVGTGTYILG